MHQRDRQQGAYRLQIEAGPFHGVDFRPVHDDPLSARIKSGFKRACDLALRRLLARVGHRERENELQRLLKDEDTPIEMRFAERSGAPSWAIPRSLFHERKF